MQYTMNEVAIAKVNKALVAMTEELRHSEETFDTHTDIGSVVVDRILDHTADIELAYESEFGEDTLAHYGIKGMKWKKHQRYDKYYAKAYNVQSEGGFINSEGRPREAFTGTVRVYNKRTKKRELERPFFTSAAQLEGGYHYHYDTGKIGADFEKRAVKNHTKYRHRGTWAYNRAVDSHNVDEIKYAAKDDFSRMGKAAKKIKYAAEDDFSRMRKSAKKLKSKIKTKLRHSDYDDSGLLQYDLAVLDQIIDNVENMTESELAEAYETLDRCESYASDFGDE